MKLVFVRHGQAAGANFPGSDADRPLTAEGQRQAAAVAAALGGGGVYLDRLLSSPLRRARETAQALVDAGVAEGVEICPQLLPERGSRALLEIIASLPTDGTYGFVGHEPLLSETAETLLFSAPRGVLVLGKGSLCVVQEEARTWRLVALVASPWLPFLPRER